MNQAIQTAMNFTWDEALAEDIKALGGRKKLAPRLWPADDEETANDRLKAALAPGHKLELKPAEILKIKEWARDVGSYGLMTFEAQLLSFKYEWINPQDEAEELRREVRNLLSEANQRLERIERAQKRSSLKEGRE